MAPHPHPRPAPRDAAARSPSTPPAAGPAPTTPPPTKAGSSSKSKAAAPAPTAAAASSSPRRPARRARRPRPRPLRRPLVYARVRAIHPTGATLADLLTAGPAPLELPQWLARRATGTTEGFFRSGAEICDPPAPRPLRARRSRRRLRPRDPRAPRRHHPLRPPRRARRRHPPSPAAASPARTPPLRDPRRRHPPRRPRRRHLTLPTATGAVRLTPIERPTATEPPTATGDYTRFTLTRQPIDPEGRATDDPIVIDGGPAPDGPAATLTRGELRVRTRRWSFDARLVTADGETARALADTGGCATRPAALRLTWTPTAVIIQGDAADRRYQLTLRR
ncbi:MAG: hypothetical protein R3F65_31865 [bacterium]